MSGQPWVIVDLADLAFIDCSSLGILGGARERARMAGGDVLLSGPRGAVTRLLLLTGWARVFPVFPSAGVAGFSAGLAAFGSRLAAARAQESMAGESVAAPVEGMVTAAASPAAVTKGRGCPAGRGNVTRDPCRRPAPGRLRLGCCRVDSGVRAAHA